MQRSAYEYTSPLNTYYNSNRGQEFDQNYSSFNQNLYPNDSKYGLSNFGNVGNTLRPDLYEGNNDNTLRAEERNWYIENHTNVHGQFMKNRDTLPRTSKDQRKEDDKKQEIEPTSAVTQRIGENERLRRKEDRCSCECWPTGSPEATISDGLAQNNKSVNQSAVDMVASYGVYQNPHDDDDQSGFVRITNRSYPYQSEQQGIVVNEAGNCSVVPRPSEIIDNHQERSAFEKCCSVFGGRSNIPASSGQEVDCWVTCCKPAIFLFLLVLMLVVFALVSGLLVYFNYMTYKPRQPLPEEPCEKTFCRWGATCVALEDGRAHCQCPARCPLVRDPVCSTDGRTYSNHCELRKESCEKRLNTRVRHTGECELSDPCRDTECPWGAQCLIEGGRATCRCPKCTSRALGPACGSDSREYAGACELARVACEQQLNVTLVYHGKCDPCHGYDCPEPQVCQLDAQRNPICRCGEVCPLTLEAVCGSDGRTYANECELRQEACRSRRQMRIIYRGKCSSGVNPCNSVQCSSGEQCWIGRSGVAQCGCGAECEPLMRPVCDATDRTHASACHLRRAACLARTLPKLAYHGTCGTAGPCANVSCPAGGACVSRDGRASCECPTCGAQLEPVCGSDGRTYANECRLRARACETSNSHANSDPLVPLYNGTCETCDDKKCEFYGVCEMESVGKTKCICPGNCSEDESMAEADSAPETRVVCGSDGQSYASECSLRSAACQLQQNISVAYIGDCSLCLDVECKFGARCSAGECICPQECSDSDSEPVCANTMITYPSECELLKAACSLPTGHRQLHVIFYGDCKDRFAVAGPPIALTTALPLSFPPSDRSNASFEVDSTTENDQDHRSSSTVERMACEDIRCDYDATCILGADGYPRCSCVFSCPLDETSEDYFPVCASDTKLYTSMCAMRMEGCHKQIELRLRPLELCKGMEARPCTGGLIMLDTSGQELDCGGGPGRRDCPVGSYCHQTMISARCCIKNDTVQRKHCEESRYGCCPDKRTPAQGSGLAGCPSGCGCHRLGALTDTCDAETGQCSCRPGVGGQRCDRCEPGYWGLPRIGAGHKGCIPCGCSMFGSVREDCEQMTGRCVCKPGIQGQKCTLCMNHQEILGPNGCFNAETGALAPRTCSDIVCYFGAVCVESESRAACQCPAASCPTDSTDPSMLVCGSDGQTYPSECHLKLQACRTQEDVVVQAFGICKGTEDPTGTALPSKHYSPLQFTQQDDTNFPSKSTRHLLVPDPRSYYNYGRGYEVSRDKDSTSSLDGEKGLHRASFASIYRPTPATVRAPPALVGDLCNSHGDCYGVLNSRCDGGACICQYGHSPAPDRKECVLTDDDISTTTEEQRACNSEPCMNFGTCIDLPEATYTCICDPQYTGEVCQEVLPIPDPIHYIETPSFDGRAFIRLKPLKAYHKLNIDVEFKSFSENGVILYDQQKLDGTGDFVSLSIVNGFVEFRYNLGDGIVILTSIEKISLNEYHKVSAKRYHRDGILSVDDHEDVVGQSTGSLKALDLMEDTFVGNVPTNISKVFDNIGTKHGFAGCIKHLRIIRHQVTKKLGKEDSAILAVENVRECTSNPCVSMPCFNGATCHASDDDDLQYSCICSGDYKGIQCEEKIDPCESNPCGTEDGVICDALTTGGFVCKCLYGGKLVKNGVNSCNYETTNLQETFVPEFNGSSYFQLPKLDGLGSAFRIEIWFLTKKLSGMILYNSQTNKAKGDFIAINLVDGYLQFRYNLGSGIANISSTEKISKDRWHRVSASRTGREGILKIDDWPAVHGHSAPPLAELNLGLPVFLGSLPFHTKPHRLSGVTSSFIGAIQQVFVNSNPLITYNEETAQCSMQPIEDILPCATIGTSRYLGFPCSETANPCQNHGSCVPMLNEYKCICKDGYDGRNCENKNYKEIIDNNTPIRFNGETYYAYRNKGGRRKPDRGIRLDIKFRTTENSGLLIWRKKGGVGHGDFLALGIIDGHAELIFSDYSSRDTISNKQNRWYSNLRSKARVDDGLWHTIVIRRRKKMALIQTDDRAPLRGYAQLPLLPSKANPKVWVGGAPSLPHGLPRQLYIGLKGCVASVKSNGRHLNLHTPIGQLGDIDKC